MKRRWTLSLVVLLFLALLFVPDADASLNWNPDDGFPLEEVGQGGTEPPDSELVILEGTVVVNPKGGGQGAPKVPVSGGNGLQTGSDTPAPMPMPVDLNHALTSKPFAGEAVVASEALVTNLVATGLMDASDAQSIGQQMITNPAEHMTLTINGQSYMLNIAGDEVEPTVSYNSGEVAAMLDSPDDILSTRSGSKLDAATIRKIIETVFGNVQLQYVQGVYLPSSLAPGMDGCKFTAVNATFATYTATYMLTDTEVYGYYDMLEYTAALPKPADPARAGYTFTGWTPDVPETMPDNSLVFTAQWQEDSAGQAAAAASVGTLTYYQDRTMNTEHCTREVFKVVHAQGNRAVYQLSDAVPGNPFIDGSRLLAWWYFDANGSEMSFTPITVPGLDGRMLAFALPDAASGEDTPGVPAYALPVTLPTYMVEYENASHGVFKRYMDIAAGEDVPVPTNNPRRDGYQFNGWKPNVPAVMPAENLRFEAKWEKTAYTLTVIVDGETMKTEYAYGAAVTPPETPVKPGHTFAGWSPAIPATMPASDLTVTAQFTANTYTLTFVMGVDRNDVTLSYAYGAAIPAGDIPALPEREGHTGAWSPAVPATMPAENVTFNPSYSINTYYISGSVLHQGDDVGEPFGTAILYGASIQGAIEAAYPSYTVSLVFPNGTTLPTMPAYNITGLKIRLMD